MTRPVGKLGLTEAPDDRPKLWWHRYVDPIDVHIPDGPLGHADKVADWGMLANDRAGDCAWAMAAHEVMVLNAANSRSVQFTDDDVLSDYAAGTGYDPKTGANDNGTNMFQLYMYRKNIGVVDHAKVRHRIQAFLEITPDKIEEVAAGVYMFGSVGIGIRVYDWMEEQFQAGEPWSPQRGGKFKGGHAIPVVGRKANGNYVVVTWGTLQEITPEFYLRYTTSAFVGVTQDYLTGDKTPEGLDSAKLIMDLPKIDNSYK